MWVGYFGFGISSSGVVGFRFVWLVVSGSMVGWLYQILGFVGSVAV